ncbi:MAG: deoxynucleoside kinase [Bacteroidales bacterium]|nr:MAG: deoxynucleoside kinase [Bacteroidales bacterium]
MYHFSAISGLKTFLNYIVIEGNIGAGKTSLAKSIASEFNGKLILERFGDNPFLPKFYLDPERYAFPLELSLLADRYNQMKNELNERDLFSSFTIADYYFMKSLIFARSTLQEDEFNIYQQIFNIIYSNLPQPDLYVYLHVNPDNLLRNIRDRGRDYEKKISRNYLEKIQKGYFEFFRQQPEMTFLVIDANNIDFVNNKNDYKNLVHMILEIEYTPGLNRVIL